MSRLKDIPLAALIEDTDLYPRNHVDSSHVRNLRLALEAGRTLPPPIVDSKNRIVDGWHRTRAYRKAFGVDAVIQCEVRRYKSDVDVVRDAVELNSGHGRKLDEKDKTRAIFMLKAQGVTQVEIANVLHITEERVVRLSLNVAIYRDEPVVVNPVAYPKNGVTIRELNDQQMEAQRSASGWKLKQQVSSLTKQLRAGFVDGDDEKLMEALRDLHIALADLLATV